MNESRGALAGRRIVVTRAEAQARELIERLRALGADVIACPTISIRPPEDFAPLDSGLRELTVFDWVVFTSANAVERSVQRLAQLRGDAGALRLVRIAAVGSATARALVAYGASPNRLPDRYTAAALVESMGDVRDLRILLPRSEIALPALPDALRAAGAQVHEVTAYRTVPADDIVRVLRERTDGRMGGEIDVIVFTSPSTARFFFDALHTTGDQGRLIRDVGRPALICIGPTTDAAIREVTGGVPADAIARTHDTDGLVAAIVEWSGGEKGKGEGGRGKG